MEYTLDFGNCYFKHSLDLHPQPKEHMYQEQFHTAYEMIYFIQGKGTFILRQNRYELNPHTLLFIQPGYYHQLILDPKVPYDRMVIRFFASYILEDLRDRLKVLKPVYAVENSLLSDAFFQLDRMYKQTSPALYRAVFTGQLFIILACLCQSGELCQHKASQTPELAKILHYIDNHISDIHTSDDLVEFLHLSSSTIQKLFRSELRTSVMSYIRTQRCIQASTLMENGFSATEASLLCGFDNYSTFYRSYLKVYGKAPTEKS